jgi:hypothetical protein
MLLVFTLAKNATKPNAFEIISLQTTRKKNNWKTGETLAKSCNSGNGTDQRVKSLMFMMMIYIFTFCVFITINDDYIPEQFARSL